MSPMDNMASEVQVAAAEEMRLDIAHRIDHLYEEMRSLKSKQNQLLPISRLPPELLFNIFSYVAHYSERLAHPCPWIAISHVSRRWRDMAINSASLWTDLPLTSRRWTEEMLRRSKMAAISIKFTSNFGLLDDVGDVLQLALAEISRAWEVRLPHISPEMTHKLFKDFPQSALKLKTLDLGIFSYVPNQAQGFILPERAFCEVPCLQRLTLHGIQINWKWELLRNLKHLGLHTEKQWSRPLLADVVEVLRQTPKLESLSLRECLPIAQRSSFISVATIALPHLQELTLSGLVPEVAMVLQHLSIPHSSKVRLLCGETQVPGPDFDRILSTLAWAKSSPCKTGPMPIQSVSLLPGLPIIDPSNCRLHFQAWTALITPQEFKSRNGYFSDSPNIDLVLSWKQPNPYFARHPDTTLIQSLFSTLSLHSMQSLYSGNVSITTNTFVEAFGALPHLASISVEGDSFTKTVVEALLNSATTPAPSLPFPSLRELVLTAARFDGEPDSLSLDDLQDCLIQRYECGGEIQKLHLQECICMNEGDEITLQEIAVDVLWDGKKIYPSDEDDEDDYECELCGCCERH